MGADVHHVRFMSYLSLFTFFMLLLVLSDNVLQLFVGWEGVGICSYLLINFWFTRIQANKAAILAVLVNKVGDIALLISCVALQYLCHSVSFYTLYASTCGLCYTSSVLDNACALFVNAIDSVCGIEIVWYIFMCVSCTSVVPVVSAVLNAYWLICVFCILAAVGKSAQAGLHMWLPEAMEGPTPVSSLIHAATMVTAGVFLLLRFSYIFDVVNTFSVLLIGIGSITAFFSSTIGLLQTDLKKVVAYSTCSQLGYMFVCLGFSSYCNSIFHLFNHAFFKALLFLTAGYVIHALSNEQDIRKMGSLIHILPFSYVMLLIGSMSIVGFPFFSGFYSKDKIVEICFNTYIGTIDIVTFYPYIMFAQTLCILAVILTLIYSIKIFFYVFFSSFSGFRYYILNIHFSTYFMVMPLLFLSVCSICSGYFTSDMMVGIGSDYWGNSFSVDSFMLPCDRSYANIKLMYTIHTEFNHYMRQITLI